MQAIILAAGMGKRLKELTQNNTKCMVKVNGITLIDRMLHQIDQKKLTRIIIVVGYKGQKLVDYIGTLHIKTPIVFIHNKIFFKTNNIFSLSLAKEWLCKEDTLLFESDLIFDNSVLDSIIDDPRETLALVDKYESWMDGTCVKLGDDDSIESFIPGKKFKFEEIKDYYKTVNIYKFSKHFSQTHYVPFLEAYQAALGQNEYYEQVLRVITMLDVPEIKAKRLTGQRWYEIDDIQDLDIAESIFTPDDSEKVSLLQNRYGGYWRYPNLLDFCYLVNPYYPPERLKNEIKSNFDVLISNYPSGMRVNSLLAAKNFGIRQENILVGNGAAELIKSLMQHISGNIGYIRPTFEEYPNRYDNNSTIVFTPINNDYSYSADDLIAFFDNKNIQNIILINPDNPSGNYIPKNELLKLIHWAKDKKIKIVIDESFVDFANEENSSIIEQKLLLKNPHLYVIKSISKSYGIPGLRLGILASGDRKTIETLKKDVAIWNINSFGEFFLQIEEKYVSDYKESLVQLKSERDRFKTELEKINGIRVIPSQANFFMIELVNNTIPEELLKSLLTKHNILIKDLSKKMNGKKYLRIAIRNSKDNNQLIQALKDELHC